MPIKPNHVYTLRLVKVENGVGGVASLVGLFYDEQKAKDCCRELNETEQTRTPNSPYQFITDCFRIE